MDDLFPDDLKTMKVEDLKKEIAWPPETLSTRVLRPYLLRLDGEELLGIQIGSERGESAYYLLETVPKLYLNIIEPTAEKLVYDNLEAFGGRSTVVDKLPPEDADGMYANDKFDFIFFESPKTYDELKKLMTLYYPKLKKGGIFAGVDYNTEPVYDAVTDFRRKEKQTQPLHVVSVGRNWFWYK